MPKKILAVGLAVLAGMTALSGVATAAPASSLGVCDNIGNGDLCIRLVSSAPNYVFVRYSKHAGTTVRLRVCSHDNNDPGAYCSEIQNISVGQTGSLTLYNPLPPWCAHAELWVYPPGSSDDSQVSIIDGTSSDCW
ncbi:hypothetical protein [Kutzneria sp. NPDC052558]|uniref:hypothetical protein n=1 Tax=Kutzneria sp. NPDC052558 TaxID=3364121 RepID=UPI0037CC2821